MARRREARPRGSRRYMGRCSTGGRGRPAPAMFVGVMGRYSAVFLVAFASLVPPFLSGPTTKAPRYLDETWYSLWSVGGKRGFACVTTTTRSIIQPRIDVEIYKSKTLLAPRNIQSFFLTQLPTVSLQQGEIKAPGEVTSFVIKCSGSYSKIIQQSLAIKSGSCQKFHLI